MMNVARVVFAVMSLTAGACAHDGAADAGISAMTAMTAANHSVENAEATDKTDGQPPDDRGVEVTRTGPESAFADLDRLAAHQ
jgi:hypothetical protein